LLRGEELRDAVSWLESERPSATWARRYSRGANPDDAFILTLRFIRRSELQRNRWRTGGVIGAFTMTIVIVALLILGAKTLFEQSALRRGDAYYYGHGVLKNDVLARNWYRKASWFGNAEAESDLGMLYEAGIGGASRNCQEAIKWFIKAARDGSTLAADHIADLQAEGCRTSGRERQSLLPTLDDVSEEYGMASDSLLKGQYKQALAEYEKVLQTNSADPQTRVDAADEIGLLYETGKGGIAHSDAAAHEAFTQALDLELSILNEMPSDPPSMSNVAYQWLLVGVPANALSMANFALVQPSDQIWMEVNKADALMLLGQTDAARAAYLKHKAADPDGKGSTWGADILEDFDTFRSIGIKNPLMAEVTMHLGK
jgi:TPR repeat protein